MKDNYIFSIVTPVKDEINFLPRTAESIISQEFLPKQWVIVNDGSTDGTTEYIINLEKQYNWIKGIHLPPEKKRRPGGEFVIGQAMEHINLDELEFLVRLDGDLQFDKEYFSRLFHRMTNNPKLGIAGGVCYINAGTELIEERNPRFHVRGALKTYKISCLKEIGGFGYDLGWDTIDEIKARMHGWETRSFHDLKVIHLKPTRGSSNWYKSRVIDAVSAYNAAYHPLYFIFRAARHFFRPPVVLGSMAMIWSFLQNYIRKVPRHVDEDYIKFIRKHQLNRLLGKDSIWQ